MTGNGSCDTLRLRIILILENTDALISQKSSPFSKPMLQTSVANISSDCLDLKVCALADSAVSLLHHISSFWDVLAFTSSCNFRIPHSRILPRSYQTTLAYLGVSTIFIPGIYHLITIIQFVLLFQ